MEAASVTLLWTHIAVFLLIGVESQEPPMPCTTAGGSYGACVLLPTCPSLNGMVHAGDPAYFELLRKNHCGFQGSIPKVCCSNEPALNFPKDELTATGSSRQTGELAPGSAPAPTTPFVTTTARPRPAASRKPVPSGQEHASKDPPMSTNNWNGAAAGDQSYTVKTNTSAEEFIAVTTTSPAPSRRPQSTPVPAHSAPPARPIMVGGGQGSHAQGSPGAEGLLPNRTMCGNFANGDKIYGGLNTYIDDFPWMALLKYRVGAMGRFACGGVLISNRYIMTAAHCVRTPNTYKLTQVRLGEWDTESEQDCEDDLCNEPPVDVDIAEVLVHPAFELQTLSNDIALLRLAVPVNYTEWIQPICLPDNSMQPDYSDESFWVAGWGQKEDGNTSTRKQKIEVSRVAPEVCRAAYRRLNATVGATTLCAGGRLGQDTCAGDSGGPLMKAISRDHRDNYFAVGVVSFGPTRCGLEGWPSVFTGVANYVDWIKASLRP